nr:unnamed protein product [Callosobruchus chinensis]
MYKDIDCPLSVQIDCFCNSYFHFRPFKMRIVLVTFVAVIACAVAQPQLHLLSDEYIDHLNSQNLPWKAGRNFDKDIPISHIKGLLGLKKRTVPSNLETIYHDDNGEELPKEFDARKQWSKCESIKEIRDQSGCGSCWAVSSAAAMSDRVCIHSDQKNQLRISDADILSCCETCGEGCNGGYTEAAFSYWNGPGVVSGGGYNTTDGCKAYPLPPCDHHIDGSLTPCKEEYPTPECRKQCDKGSHLKYNEDKHHGKKTYLVPRDERQIQLEIVKNGPVVAGFHVYADFVSYKSGVYQRDHSGKYLGDHAVRVIGYGVEKDKYPYWLVTNSWNDHWGDKGLFKIMRGNNECGFEEEIMRIHLLTLAIVIAPSISKPELHPLSDEYIEYLNNKNLPWKAGRNFDKDIPFSYLKRLLGAKTMEVPSGLETIYHEDNGEDLLKEFDSRKRWSKCQSIAEIRDQSGCGSCWAVSAASVMSDRLCIHSNQTNQLRMSGQDIVECCGKGRFGCNGGFVESAFDFWVDKGVVSGGGYNTTNGCKAYQLPSCSHIHSDTSLPPCKDYPSPQCNKQCDKVSELKYYEDKHNGNKSYLIPQDERQIQLEIIKNGPVVAVFHVYQDFFSYKSGVYVKDNSSRYVGDHAVRVIGYGVQDDIFPYWLATNSWNDHWGDKGVFKIMRGKNEFLMMKLAFIALAAVVCCTAAQAKLHFLSDEYIKYLNSKQLPWKAGRNFDKDIPLSQIQGLLGLRTSDAPSTLETIYHEDNGEDLPEEFDARKQWSKCESIKEIRDQSACGSCWAVSSASVMSDRVCIHSDQKNQLRISAADLLECCRACGFGCGGGYTDAAFDYWKYNGIVSGGEYNSTEGCKPYPLPRCDHHIDGSSNPCKAIYDTPQCKRECDKDSDLKYNEDKHNGRKAYKVSGDERQIQLELIKNGPVVASFFVHADFVNYKSGVYMSDGVSKTLGGHAVRIIGYGVENGTYPYWLVTNSWNEHWGDKGLFKIMRGTNECGIELAKMKVCLLILSVATLYTLALPTLHPLSDEYIKQLNNKGLPWKAGRNFHKDTPLSYIKGLLGVISKTTVPLETVRYEDVGQDIPEEFDARKKWPKCDSIKEIRDQSACGASWAVSTVAAISDRICIHSNQQNQVRISGSDLLACCERCGKGCEGGSVEEAGKYYKEVGIVSGGEYNSSTGCKPYPLPHCDHHDSSSINACKENYSTPKCERQCEKNSKLQYNEDKHYGLNSYYILNDQRQIQLEIMQNGPVVASFQLFADFINYKSGVYKADKTSQILGNHAVRVIGWGTEDGNPYWLVTNSWNKNWGDEGLFKIMRGTSECGFELGMVATLPK